VAPALARTAVVHLVRHANGPEPFRRFVASYERFDAGLEHDLVLLFKGFDDRAERAPYLERCAAWAPASVELSDAGQDLTAYVAAAALLRHERLCFVNSFSEISAAGWLGVLDAALASGHAGAAGATGSWASRLSYRLYQAGLGGPYSGVFASRGAARRALQPGAGAGAVPVRAGQPTQAANLVRELVMTARTAPFPAAHLRTNAFLVDRELFSSLRTGRAQTKWAAYALESGRGSITSQLRARGFEPVVVDRHGSARAPEEWDRGDVFCQAGQEDLLVADNQTRRYAAATVVQRAALSAFAWAGHARPG
jgi:hypothetical protein